METEPQSQFVVSEMTPSDVGDVTEMRLQSWLDTYPNEEHGVDRKWIEQRNTVQLSSAIKQKRLERFRVLSEKGQIKGWVARDSSGSVVGATTPYIDEDGSQHVGSLYVDKNWHGRGVGPMLMQNVIDWFDPARPIFLGVVSYNERAMAFYRKWGFEEVPDSEELFDEKIPEVHMIRKAQQ